jgi:hypothetical protein
MRSNDPAEQRLTKWEKEIDAKQRLPNQGIKMTRTKR